MEKVAAKLHQKKFCEKFDISHSDLVLFSALATALKSVYIQMFTEFENNPLLSPEEKSALEQEVELSGKKMTLKQANIIMLQDGEKLDLATQLRGCSEELLNNLSQKSGHYSEFL